MCEGERRRLIVLNMAHGQGTKGVPPYSDVQYDLELSTLQPEDRQERPEGRPVR